MWVLVTILVLTKAGHLTQGSQGALGDHKTVFWPLHCSQLIGPEFCMLTDHNPTKILVQKSRMLGRGDYLGFNGHFGGQYWPFLDQLGWNFAW